MEHYGGGLRVLRLVAQVALAVGELQAPAAVAAVVEGEGVEAAEDVAPGSGPQREACTSP